MFNAFLLSSDSNINTDAGFQPGDVPVGDKHPLLTNEQENTLEKIGIDPAKLPTEITPEMEKCFIEKLGAERVKEIKDGLKPSVLDLFRVKSCISN